MAEISRGDVMSAQNPPNEGGTPTPGQEPAAPKATPQADPAQPQPPVQEPAAPGAPASPDEYTYPDDDSIPEMLRGKRASEAADAYRQLFETSRNLAQYVQQQPMQQQYQQPFAPQAPPAAEPLFGPDDFVTGDPQQIEDKLGKLFERKAAPFVVDVYKGLTISSMHTARQTLPHFQKYEQEIMQELGNLPINVTAHYSTWKDAHDRVVARHITELTAAGNQGQGRPKPPVSERGNGAPPAVNPVEQLTQDDIQIADGLGVPREIFARMKGVYSRNQGA